jgi:hypothetical protein
MTKKEVKSLLDPNTSVGVYNDIKEELSIRCDHIVRTIAELQGIKVDWWDFDNAEATLEEGQGDFDEQRYQNDVSFIGEFRKPRQKKKCFAFIVDDDRERENSFPTEWIWMDDEVWMNIVKKTFKAYEVKEEERLNKERIRREEVKNKKAEIRAAIVGKLTDEELRYIIFR